jgi:hypothetical protein
VKVRAQAIVAFLGRFEAEAEPLCALPHCFCQERLSEMVRIEALAASVRFA